MVVRRAATWVALATAVCALVGCTAQRTLDISDIDDSAGGLDFSVNWARVEQTSGRTLLIVEMEIDHPSASIVLSNRVDLGHSYVLWCEGDPQVSPSSRPSTPTWTYDCEGDTDWPSDIREAHLTIERSAPA